ncbi:MAG: carboxylating nicotinate-nucleotide diphosphorylase [Cyclobacteriaceae bacterium]|nr:carboxylating nicotinate-nucleotide diphosphorylase [Cyclobacteriaceae bacterium]
MKPPYITDSFLKQFISTSLAEDVGDGDHSSLASIAETASGKARLLVKDDGILAGVELAVEIFKHFDDRIELEIFIQDGALVKKGDVAFTVSGFTRSILTTERLVLNCMQRMSGIATTTKRLVKLVAGSNAQLLDTRKTTPNFRLLEKWAVLIGGGRNHRIGLFDMIMLKDNHIDGAGGIEQAINRTKEYLRTSKKDLKVEIETRNLDEVREVLRVGGVDVIMLDNMSLSDMKAAVELIDGTCKTEASGGITEETIRQVAECGVDYISVGALTHSVKSLDLSLKMF